MNWTQHVKYVNITPPAAVVDNASYTTTVVDTAGYDHLTVLVSLGATDIAMTALKVQESDDSGMSGAADITGTIFGTSTNDAGSTSALPTANDDDDIFAIEIPLQGRKRYIDVVATAGNGAVGTYASIIGILGKASTGPATAVESGLNQRLIA
jgi:hypothetical protein